MLILAVSLVLAKNCKFLFFFLASMDRFRQFVALKMKYVRRVRYCYLIDVAEVADAYVNMLEH